MPRHPLQPFRISWHWWSGLRLAVLLALCPAATHALTPAEYDARIEKLEQEIEALEQEKDQVLQELREGLFCSICEKSKREIEKREPFDQHLANVKGEPVPASELTIARRKREYDEKIARLRNQIAALRNQSERDEKRARDDREEKRVREKAEAERAREEKKEDRETKVLLSDSYSGSSSSEPRISPAEQKIRAQAQFINGLANLVGIFERKAAARREEKLQARAEAKAAEQREAAHFEEMRQRAAAAEKDRQKSGKEDWLSKATREVQGLAWFADGYAPPLPLEQQVGFIGDVLQRSGADLAEGMKNQLVDGHPLDLKEAAKDGIAGELTGLAYDTALETLSPEARAKVQVARAVNSWTTLSPSTIWDSYDDLTKTEFFEQLDKITVSGSAPKE